MPILLKLPRAMLQKSKINLRYTRGITPKRVTSGGAYLHAVVPGQHSSEETSQRWQAVGDAVSASTDLEIES